MICIIGNGTVFHSLLYIQVTHALRLFGSMEVDGQVENGDVLKQSYPIVLLFPRSTVRTGSDMTKLIRYINSDAFVSKYDLRASICLV